MAKSNYVWDDDKRIEKGYGSWAVGERGGISPDLAFVNVLRVIFAWPNWSRIGSTRTHSHSEENQQDNRINFASASIAFQTKWSFSNRNTICFLIWNFCVALFIQHCSSPTKLCLFPKFCNTHLLFSPRNECFHVSFVCSLLLSTPCFVELPPNICRRSKCWAIRSHHGSEDNIRHSPLFAPVIVYPTCCDTLKREPMEWVNYSDSWTSQHIQGGSMIRLLNWAI